MSTPAGVGPLCLTDIDVPALMGQDDDVAAYALAARVLTPEDAPEEWNEPTPVACLDLRSYAGSRLDARGLRELEQRCNQVLGQDDHVSDVTATLTQADRVLSCRIVGLGDFGPFDFTISANSVTASLLRGA